MSRMHRSIKTLLNRLIDDAVHPKGHARKVETIIVDEVLHTLVEGKFKPEKFVRYTLLPSLRGKKPRKTRRRRKSNS